MPGANGARAVNHFEFAQQLALFIPSSGQTVAQSVAIRFFGSQHAISMPLPNHSVSDPTPKRSLLAKLAIPMIITLYYDLHETVFANAEMLARESSASSSESRR